jgi:hypothetical protein
MSDISAEKKTCEMMLNGVLVNLILLSPREFEDLEDRKRSKRGSNRISVSSNSKSKKPQRQLATTLLLETVAEAAVYAVTLELMNPESSSRPSFDSCANSGRPHSLDSNLVRHHLEQYSSSWYMKMSLQGALHKAHVMRSAPAK